jgi:hypothetical protein
MRAFARSQTSRVSTTVRPPNTGEAARSFPSDQAYVRVLGVRLRPYVEFDDPPHDGDLAVQLILPFAAFEQFAIRRRPPTSSRSISVIWPCGLDWIRP